MESIFIGIEIDIKEGKLFYDSVSNGSSTRDNQVGLNAFDLYK